MRPARVVCARRVKSGRFEDHIFARQNFFTKYFATEHFSAGKVMIRRCHDFRRHFPDNHTSSRKVLKFLIWLKTHPKVVKDKRPIPSFLGDVSMKTVGFVFGLGHLYDGRP